MVGEKNWTSRLYNVLVITFLSALALLCLAPMVHLLAVSLSGRAVSMGGFVTFWPINFTLQNYVKVLTANAFLRAFFISIQRTILGTALNISLIVLMAYPLSKTEQEFKGRNIFMWLLIFAMIFYGGLIPTFLVVRSLGMIDKLSALILPEAVQIWSIIMMMNFFRDIPRELEEAAVIDGASHWQILTRVFLPLCTPALATLALFAAVGHWNSWFDGAIFNMHAENYPLQTFLRTVVIQLDLTRFAINPNDLGELSDRSMRAAQIFVTIVPILLVYPFLQRYFIAGIKLGAIKG